MTDAPMAAPKNLQAIWPLVRAKVSAMLQVPLAQITPEQTFAQLKFDSLDLVELQMDLEMALDLDLLEGSLRDVNVMQLRLGELVQRLEADRGAGSL
jgi:acyl carrier protein